MAWVEELRDDAPEMIAIDGKTSRRSHARSKGCSALHTVSAWASRQRLVLGQEAVSEKANEIVAIPLLLRRLELRGALVTIDAMGTQKGIAQTILDGGADYVLALKENRPATYAEVEKVFAAPPPTLDMQHSETIDADHGRIETRRHTVCHDVSWLFEGIASVVMQTTLGVNRSGTPSVSQTWSAIWDERRLRTHSVDGSGLLCSASAVVQRTAVWETR